MTAIKTIGILGAGQLGRMTAVAAAQMGFRAHIFAPDSKDSPAAEVAQTFTQANYNDSDALAAFGRSIDVVTSEFENEDAATEGTEPNKCDVKITEFKVENTKWKKGGLADE